MVSIRPLIANSFSLLCRVLGTVWSAPVTTGITVTLMFHSYLSSLIRSKSLFFFSFSLIFYSVVWWDGKLHDTSFFFLSIITKSDFLAVLRWSVCIPKHQRIACISFFRTDSSLCIYHLVVWSNFIFWHHSQWITFNTQLCIVFYFFCTSLLHSLIMWLTVSSLSQHNVHFLISCVLSIFF